MSSLVDRFVRPIRSALASLLWAALQLPRPFRYSVLLGSALDIARSYSDLVAENALLRRQLIILHRLVSKPRFTPTDRLWLVLLVSRVRRWKEALLILKPDTLLRWHHQGFRLFWKFVSRNRGGSPTDRQQRVPLTTLNMQTTCHHGNSDGKTCRRCDSVTIESLYSSNHRRRHRRESGQSKGRGRSESRPIPKQAFVGSPAQAAGQEIPPPAQTAKNKTLRPPMGGRRVLQVTCPVSKDSRAFASSIDASASDEPTLAVDAPS